MLPCKAKTAEEDVGDSSTAYRWSAEDDPGNPDSKADLAPEKVFGEQPQLGRARKANKQGQVIVAAVIDEDGCAQELKVTRGLDTRWDQEALAAFRNWVFRPATLSSLPVRVPTEWVVDVSIGS